MLLVLVIDKNGVLRMFCHFPKCQIKAGAIDAVAARRPIPEVGSRPRSERARNVIQTNKMLL